MPGGHSRQALACRRGCDTAAIASAACSGGQNACHSTVFHPCFCFILSQQQGPHDFASALNPFVFGSPTNSLAACTISATAGWLVPSGPNAQLAPSTHAQGALSLSRRRYLCHSWLLTWRCTALATFWSTTRPTSPSW